jgi:hypothetical protein
MIEPRIDAIARALASGGSRRRLLAGIGGGAVAGLVALSRPAPACQRVGTACDAGHPCCVGGICQDGRCACRADRVACSGSGRCIDTAADADHCGRCGHACRDGKACCGGRCVAVKEDRANCGGCGVVCDEGALCVLGYCQPCSVGTVPCGTVCRAAERCGRL